MHLSEDLTITPLHWPSFFSLSAIVAFFFCVGVAPYQIALSVFGSAF
jgi:hypothetical protein